MADTDWAACGLDDDTLAELQRRASQYAANRLSELHRDDATQNGLCRVLYVVLNPPENLPKDPSERLDYLTKCMIQEISLMIPQDHDGPTPRLPHIPTD